MGGIGVIGGKRANQMVGMVTQRPGRVSKADSVHASTICRKQHHGGLLLYKEWRRPCWNLEMDLSQYAEKRISHMKAVTSSLPSDSPQVS